MYSRLVIGLFGLIGMVGVTSGPFMARSVNNLVPWYAIIMVIPFLPIQTSASDINVAAVAIATIGLDVYLVK